MPILYGGDFEKRELIGKGGMAWVYKGWQRSVSRAVAIKIMFPHLAEDERFRRRFIDAEASGAASLQHENTVQVYRAGDEGAELYIAMEFIDGLTLGAWLEKHGHLPLEIALLIFRDICRGLEHAHERNVVHRDIKPSNVMFTFDGTVKLADFGLARRMDQDSGMSIPGIVMGTPHYMSPEQAAGQPASHLSDIFSLGILGYELLGAERPFNGGSESEVSYQIQKGEARPLGKLNPLVPRSVVDVIHEMLAKIPERRTPTVSEVLRHVEDGLETLEVRRDRALLREYAREPEVTAKRLNKDRLARCLNQAMFFESQGLDRIEEAILAFGQVLAINPEHAVAKERYRKLMEKITKSGQQGPGESGPTHPSYPLPADQRQAPSRSPIRMFVAAALVLIAFSVVAWWVFALVSQKPSPEVTSPPPEVAAATDTPAPSPAHKVTVKTIPTGAIATLGDLPARATPARFDSVRTGSYQISATLTGYRAFVGTLTLAPGRDTVLILPLDAALPVEKPGRILPATARLRITTTPPGAAVLIDHRTQLSPAQFEGLPPRLHLVRIDLAGFAVLETNVQLNRGRDTLIHFTLRANTPPKPTEAPVAQQKPTPAPMTPPAPSPTPVAPPASAVATEEPQRDGILIISATPAPQYYVDDELRGSGRPSIQLHLSAGSHRVRLDHPSYEIKEFRSVPVGQDSTTNLTWNFERDQRQTKIFVGRDGKYWGYVILDNRELKLQTPVEIPVRPGRHSVWVKHDGFKPDQDRQTVTVGRGETTPISFSLTPIK